MPGSTPKGFDIGAQGKRSATLGENSTLGSPTPEGLHRGYAHCDATPSG